MRVIALIFIVSFSLISESYAQWWVAPPKSKSQKSKTLKKSKKSRSKSRSRSARKRSRSQAPDFYATERVSLQKVKKDDHFFLRVQPQAGFSVFSLGGGDANFVLDDSQDEVNYFKGRTGALGGVLTELNLGMRQFTIETGLSFYMAGAATGDIGALVPGGNSSGGEINVEYIGLPIFAKYYLTDYSKTSFFAKIGIIPAFAMSKEVVTDNRLSGSSFFSTSTDQDEILSEEISSFDVLMGVGMGANVRINKNWSANVEGQLYHGVISLTESDQEWVFNQGLALTLGLGYLF